MYRGHGEVVVDDVVAATAEAAVMAMIQPSVKDGEGLALKPSANEASQLRYTVLW